jgi:hypothetical protein
MLPISRTPQFFYRATSFRWFSEEIMLQEYWNRQSLLETTILVEKFGKEAIEEACQKLSTRYIPEVRKYLEKQNS